MCCAAHLDDKVVARARFKSLICFFSGSPLEVAKKSDTKTHSMEGIGMTGRFVKMFRKYLAFTSCRTTFSKLEIDDDCETFRRKSSQEKGVSKVSVLANGKTEWHFTLLYCPVLSYFQGIFCKALAKWTCKSTQVLDLRFISPPTCGDLHQLAATCVDLRWLWSSSNLDASRHKFFYHLATRRKSTQVDCK